MNEFENMNSTPMGELDDDMLENVSGGVSIGDVVDVKSWQVQYCEGCGRSLMRYQAIITGVRGTVDGHTLYWVKRNCCGYMSCISETAII